MAETVPAKRARKRSRYLSVFEALALADHVDRIRYAREREERQQRLLRQVQERVEAGKRGRPRMEIYSMGRWWAVRAGRDR